MDLSVLFGRRPIEELLKHKSSRVKRVFLSTGVRLSAEFDELLTQVEVERMEPPFFREKEREHQINNSQGIIAYVTQSAPVGFNQLLEKAKGSTCKIIVALDQIQDPHNLGAIFRVCDAVGVAGLFYTADRSTGLTSVARKVSAGASEFLAYSEVKNLARSLEQARKEGYLIYGTSLEESSQSLYEAVYSEPMVIVFGSEGEGLRKQTKELCDVLISIPMAGTVQSLNVSTSASAVLFEIKRKLSIEN